MYLNKAALIQAYSKLNALLETNYFEDYYPAFITHCMTKKLYKVGLDATGKETIYSNEGDISSLYEIGQWSSIQILKGLAANTLKQTPSKKEANTTLNKDTLFNLMYPMKMAATALIKDTTYSQDEKVSKTEAYYLNSPKGRNTPILFEAKLSCFLYAFKDHIQPLLNITPENLFRGIQEILSKLAALEHDLVYSTYKAKFQDFQITKMTKLIPTPLLKKLTQYPTTPPTTQTGIPYHELNPFIEIPARNGKQYIVALSSTSTMDTIIPKLIQIMELENLRVNPNTTGTPIQDIYLEEIVKGTLIPTLAEGKLEVDQNIRCEAISGSVPGAGFYIYVSKANQEVCIPVVLKQEAVGLIPDGLFGYQLLDKQSRSLAKIDVDELIMLSHISSNRLGETQPNIQFKGISYITEYRPVAQKALLAKGVDLDEYDMVGNYLLGNLPTLLITQGELVDALLVQLSMGKPRKAK